MSEIGKKCGLAIQARDATLDVVVSHIEAVLEDEVTKQLGKYLE